MGDVHARIGAFILENLLLGDDTRMPAANDSLMETGVIDSTGILEMIEYLEQEFDITVEDAEAVPDNLDGIDRIAAFVDKKSRAA